MIHTSFKRSKNDVILCEGCGTEIKIKQPHFEIYFDFTGVVIPLCEDCGNDLQNDMSDEYCKFVDLGL